MTLPKFTLTGTVETLTGDTLTPLATEVELTPNFPWNSFLSTDDADALLLIHPVDVVTDDAGHFSVDLLADDESLGLATPVQWQVKVGGLPAWWFNAPADGTTIDLKDTSSVTGVFPSYATAKGDTGATGLQGPDGTTPRWGVSPIRASGAPVEVEFTFNASTLSWNGADGDTIDLRTLTEEQYSSYFSLPMVLDPTGFFGNGVLYPMAPQSGNYGQVYHIFGLTTDSTRIRIEGDGLTGRNYDPFILIDGQPVASFLNQTFQAYDGHSFGVLLTFPSADMRTVEVVSKLGYMSFWVDAGKTKAPYRRPTPKVAIIGDSWIEGTTQAPFVQSQQILQGSNWRVLANGSGGTGYTTTPGIFSLKYGDAERIDPAVAWQPDVLALYGGGNDVVSAPADVAAALDTLLARLNTDLPDTQLVLYAPQDARTTMTAHWAAMKAVAANYPRVIVLEALWQDKFPGALRGPNDFVHPSPIGAEWVASNIIADIKTVMDQHNIEY
jgi:lysophospholipase L1-like esterase